MRQRTREANVLAGVRGCGFDEEGGLRNAEFHQPARDDARLDGGEFSSLAARDDSLQKHLSVPQGSDHCTELFNAVPRTKDQQINARSERMAGISGIT